jgi:NAD(P)-dependent dehydrogenase (short-subunit alcohol dehydrogenase family)
MSTRLLPAAVIAAMIMAFIATKYATAQESEDTSSQKAVLITGASTGIGRKMTEVLAANGYFVYAGARKQSDLDALNQIENVHSIRLDVTIQEEIDAAVETVRGGGRGLFGLVNNAGVIIAGPMIEVDENDLAWLFDVNVLGPYRITQAFAPLIIESKGRITNISSISGILSFPFYGQYAMSKHAIEAYSDALAGEMERFDVKVSVIEPGNFRSQIGKNQAKQLAEQSYAKEGSPFAEDIADTVDYLADRSKYKEPDEVAAAAMHALFDDNPKRRYLVVPNQEEADWTIRKAVQELVQLNSDHTYSYSRAQLIDMLDEEMATK